MLATGITRRPQCFDRTAGQDLPAAGAGRSLLPATVLQVELLGETRTPVGVMAPLPDRPEASEDEIRWQLTHMLTEVRTALRALPSVGQNRSGPLGPGLLSSGLLGTIIGDLQAGVALPDQGGRISTS